MRCPNCGLVNPDSAQRCDCGYDFPSGTLKAPDPGAAPPAPAQAAPWVLESLGVLLLGFGSCQTGVAFSHLPISRDAYSAAILAPALVGVVVIVAARLLGISRRGRARLFAGAMLLLVLGNCGVWRLTLPPSGTVGGAWPPPNDDRL